MAFHPYPQLIRRLFNADRFGPPRGVTHASPWPWVDHLVSRLPPLTNRPIQTRFRFGSAAELLNLASDGNSWGHYAKGTPSSHMGTPTACRHTVSGTISLPYSGCFSPFPHGTCALSVSQEYLALEGGPPSFPQDSTCPAVLGNYTHRYRYLFAYGAFTLYGRPFQNRSAKDLFAAKSP